jgi:hypothetical protein
VGEGFSVSDLGTLWRFCGYMRGPHYLDALIQAVPGARSRPWPATLPTSPEERARLVAAGRRLVLTMCMRSAGLGLSDIALLHRQKAASLDQLEEQEEVHRIGRGIIPVLDPRDGLHSGNGTAMKVEVDSGKAAAGDPPTPVQTEVYDHRFGGASGPAEGSVGPNRPPTVAAPDRAVKRSA